MRNAILLMSLIAATGCAHGPRGPDRMDPEVLEVQATVLEYVLRDSQAFLQEVRIQQVCVVGAIKTRRLGRRTWAGDRRGKGDWPSEVLVDRLVASGWNVLPVKECQLTTGRWISRRTGDDVAIASAAGIDWATDETVFVDAGLARSRSESFKYSCTVDRTDTGWAVRECESTSAP
jgi:hypothetical protein